MSDIIGGFGSLVDKLLWRNDDDVFDRLSHRWTPALFAGFAILLSTTQYVGDPIHCWAPVHFHGSWESYTDNYCWVKNTYWLPMDEEISRDVAHREKNPIIYYQWVPLILMCQALLFYLPVVIWRSMNSRTGIDLNDIVETAEKFQHSDDMDTKTKVLYYLTKQTHRYLGISKKPPRKGILRRFSEGTRSCIASVFSPCCGKYFGTYITSIYLMMKLIMLVNAVGQLFLLNRFLGFDYSFYGFYVIEAMIRGEDWSESPRFPRVTMCDFDIRRLGNVHRYTLQCVLSINLFNEMVFLVIWFWILLLATLTSVGIILLIARIAYKPDRSVYIKKHLVCDDVFDPDSEKDRLLMDEFVNEYLRLDGVLMLRLVGHNTNKVVVNEFASALFQMYRGLPSKAAEKAAEAMEPPAASHLADPPAPAETDPLKPSAPEVDMA